MTNTILEGGSGADTIYGSDGKDTINGANGADQLFGALGNDTLRGGNGNDVFAGGAGNDRLIGDAGTDRFQVYATNGNDDLVAVFISATKLQVLRRTPGAAAVRERDAIVHDADDLLDVLTLAGNDTIDVALSIAIGGLIDGKDGNDTCSAPAGWTIQNCEG